MWVVSWRLVWNSPVPQAVVAFRPRQKIWQIARGTGFRISLNIGQRHRGAVSMVGSKKKKKNRKIFDSIGISRDRDLSSLGFSPQTKSWRKSNTFRVSFINWFSDQFHACRSTFSPTWKPPFFKIGRWMMYDEQSSIFRARWWKDSFVRQEQVDYYQGMHCPCMF